MGTWGFGAFDNDNSVDWCYALKYAEDLAPVENALSAILNRGKFEEYLEAPECCEALAAAEVVAALRGKASAQLPEEAREFIERNCGPPSEELLQSTRAAVTAVRGESELRHLWDETEDVDHWLKAVDDLCQRLES